MEEQEDGKVEEEAERKAGGREKKREMKIENEKKGKGEGVQRLTGRGRRGGGQKLYEYIVAKLGVYLIHFLMAQMLV